MPSPSLSAVSKDSARRCLRSSRGLKRSITASIVCFWRSASGGTASISCSTPSTRTRTKPCARSCSNTCACSPLRSRTTGASSMQRCSRSGRQREHLVDHLADGLRLQRVVVVRAARRADARVQQAQVVVDLGDGADGRARVVRGRLLLDRDRRRQALDVVDVGLLHHAQELARVGRQRLDVAALAFGVDRVEGQRGLARAGQAGDHDQLVARQVEIDVLEVVRPRAADADEVQRHEAVGIRRANRGA